MPIESPVGPLATVDEIRAEFKKHGVVIKDMKNGIDWAYEE